MKAPQITFTFGDRLRRTRLEAGIEIQEMAELLLVSRNSPGNWEGGRTVPTPRRVQRWAEIVAERTDYTVSDILEFLESDNPAITHERRRNERRHVRKPSSECTTGDIGLIAA